MTITVNISEYDYTYDFLENEYRQLRLPLHVIMITTMVTIMITFKDIISIMK